MKSATQQSFNPINYNFSWTEDGWYKWDRTEAHKAARRARDTEMKAHRKAGGRCKGWTNRDQLIRRGGIGSGRPDVEFFVNVYMINYY